MSNTNQIQNNYTGKEFVITRTFDAPRNVIFNAWANADEMKNWWGPKGFKVLASKQDFKPGGFYHYGLQAPDGGAAMWGKLAYTEIKAPEKLVFINSFSDENGGLTRHPMSPTWPIEMVTIYEFAESNDKTTLTIHWLPLNPSAEERKTFEESFDGMKQGWTGTFEQFEAYLKTLK